MNYNNIFRSLLQFCLIMSVIFMPSSLVLADCSFEETPTGYSIICSGTILEEIMGTDQQDIIHIRPDASFLYYLTDFGDNLSEAMITGIFGLQGNDEITNEGDIESLWASAETTAVGVSLTIDGAVEGDSSGAALSDSSASAYASAVGIDGGTDNDMIDNWANISADAQAVVAATGVATDITVTLDGNVSGVALSDASVTADAAATGIDGGEGTDSIDNRGDIELLSNSDATGVAVSLDVAGTMKGDAEGSSVSDASVTAMSMATGIEGGEGDDTIDNEGMITLMNGSGDDETDASATAASVGLTVSGSMEGNVAGEALSDSSATADAMATGIDGGSGIDEITNRGVIVGNVDSSATAVGVAVDIGITEEGNVSGAALSDASVTANAVAIGIDGGGNKDTIDNRGDGDIDLSSTSEATGVAVSVTLAGSMEGNTDGTALSDSSTTANATATGIDGGAGMDEITNRAHVTADVDSTATGVSVSVPITITGEGSAVGSAVSDASVAANASATGIDGGDGDDTIVNTGAITLMEGNDTDASATGVAVGLNVSGKVSLNKSKEDGEVPEAVVSEDDESDAKDMISGEAVSSSGATANVEAMGIEGGGGVDDITNTADILADVGADATSVSVALDVAGSVTTNSDAEVDITGAALSDASATANAAATGIDGGAGGDTIGNQGYIDLSSDSDATGVAASLSVAGAITCKGDTEAEIEGSAVSDTSVTANAVATGIDGGVGVDMIHNETVDGVENAGTINLEAISNATGVSASLGVTTAVTINGGTKADVAGSTVSDASVTANALTTGIAGGEDGDGIDNEGYIDLHSDSSATGVAAGLGFTSVVTVKGNTDAEVTGETVSDTTVDAYATAIGIDGGGGVDTIDNSGDMDLLAISDALGVAASLDVTGSLTFKGAAKSDVTGAAASKSSVTATAAATGIEGGDGDDTITNTGVITIMDGDDPDAVATAVAASLSVAANAAIKGISTGTVSGTALSESISVGDATATGIDGGAGDDTIDNEGAINVLPNSDATSVAASVAVTLSMSGEAEGSAMGDSSVMATAAATGIDGGDGMDIITNKGAITLMKQEVGENEEDATALGVAVSLSISGNVIGTTEGEALSEASVTADAAATGIDGGADADTITNTGKISADVDSHAEGVSVAADITVTGDGTAAGSALSEASVTANAAATGIDGGDGDDTIINETDENVEGSGEIELFATSDATATAVSVSIAGAMNGTAEGGALSKAGVVSDSVAIGIDGGGGVDTIENRSGISGEASSTADATSVSVGITVGVHGKADGEALSDASVTALGTAIGIAGGDGVDTIENEGLIDMDAISSASATTVSVQLSGSMGGVAEGKAAADGSATALSETRGIAGGRGDDNITSSENGIATFADAISDTTSVSVSGGGSIGLAKNASVANASSLSETSSTAIDGGSGNDTIENASEIKATAKADAEATATSVGVTIGVGSAETVGTGDSSATARANATGIEGGGEDDKITNSAAIIVGGEDLDPMANAQAGATTVTVGLAVGLNTAEASSNAAAIAEANAAGISAGSGDDRIDNSATITVGTDSLGTGGMAIASATSTTVDISVTVGASLGETSSDTSSTAAVNLAGISGGSGDDDIYNSGAIMIGADPYKDGITAAMATANAASETVDVDITVGGSFSDASSNASATAQSSSTGIETDVGNDRIIDNTGIIHVFSSSEAVGLGKTTTASLTLGASDGSAQSNASSLSTALATGIDSGGDADEITTDSDVVVKARAISTTLSESTNYNILSVGSALQSAEANSSSTVEAIARGIDGGSGVDTITVAGNYEVSADTQVDSTSRSSTVTGLAIGYNAQEAQSRAGTVSDALAIGIDGGEGNDEINSTASLTVITHSGALITGTSSSNTGFNIAGSSSGESVAGATSDVTASGIGIRGGTSVLDVGESDADVIINEGRINVTTTVSAATDSTSTSDSITFIGEAKGTAVSDASANVLADGIGIDGGADNDTITSKNTITVKTTADASVNSRSEVDSYATFGGASSMGVSDASANVLAEATGISGGTGDDTITSHALIDIEAQSIGSVSAISDIDADVTFGGASSKAASDASVTKQGSATGIDGGDGSDVIINYDRLNVRAISAGTVTSTSRASADAIFGGTSSITTTAAALEGAVDTAGIIGGSGVDRITNLGRIDSIADANLHVENSSVATADSTFGSSDARAFSVSTLQGKASSLGVSGDDGDDFIENAGVVNVRAIANADIETVTVAIADSTFGSEYTEAASSNYAAGESTAEGITTGTGNDEILNTEVVTVEAGGTVSIESAVYSSDGPASSDARTMALSYASGINSGADDDTVSNTNTVFVKTAPHIESVTRTFGKGGVNGNVGILLDVEAMGITGGEGNDTISNGGNVLVFIGAPETESTVSEEVMSGGTAVTDNNRIGEDTEAIVGKWIRIAGGENPDFFTQVVVFDPLTGEMTLRDALVYDLPLDATYTICDYGNKEVDITEVDATIGGNTRVDVSTAASIDATGIKGGDGDDEIVNSGSVAVSASNLIKTVSFKISGTVNADTDIESTVHATGIAGDGDDDISSVTEESAGGTAMFIDTTRIGEDPEAIVGKRIRFKTGESADFFTVVAEFDPETGTFILRDPIPEGGLSKDDIYALGGGSNGIMNEGVIDVAANSAIDASSWSLTFGNADIEASGRAKTVSIGVEGGEYDDFVENIGSVDTRSTTEVLSTQRAAVIFGGAQQKLVFEAVTTSVGISAGPGDDIIVNGDDESAELAAINVDAVATADVNGVTTTYINFKETNNLVDARSTSTAMGIDLGEGQNDAYNTGEINVSALSTTEAEAISDYDYYDETNARANAAAMARASGISAEDGGDTVQSSRAITVDATAVADSFARGSDVIGGTENDFTSAVTGDSDSGSFTFTDGSLISADPNDIVGRYVRFLTGNNEDFTTLVTGFVPSTGAVALAVPLPGELKAVEVDSNGNVVTPADEYTLANGRDGESGAFANAFATGIKLNNGLITGDTMVEIEETLHVRADADADSTAEASWNGNANAGATALAEARGILTGKGDDVVTNEGIITVEAEASTSASGSGVTENITATAIGIETGEGDDAIINSGSILSGIVLNGADPVVGVGILAGAGNDTVVLDDGSSITGDVDLGADDDTLYLIGSPVVNGDLLPDGEGSPDGGIDSLIFEGAGFFVNPLDGFNRATKQGGGTYAVPSLPTMQWLEVTEGTLETNSDYNFASDGMFQTNVESDGAHGKLQVIGSSVLDGGLTVLRGQGVYVNGATYDIIEATGITGTFNGIVLPIPTTLLSFDVNQHPDIVEVEVNAKSFTTVGTNRVELAIAKYLDRINPTATGDLSNVIGEFQLLSPSEFGVAFASLSPGLYDNLTRTMYDAAHHYTTTLLKRIHSVQLLKESAVSRVNLVSGEGRALLAYNGSAASIGQLYTSGQQKHPKYSLWLDGFGQWGVQDKDDGFSGYDYNVYGVTFGVDRLLSDRCIAGIAIGYSDTDIDVDRDQGDGEIDTVYGSLYGSYFTEKGYIDAVLSYGNQDCHNKRRVVIGSIQREARSDHDGDLYSAFVEGGYNIDVNTWILQPFASLHYLYLDEEGFAEKGAGSVNLIIDGRETESLVSELGLRVTRSFQLNSGTLIPEVSAAWNYDFDIDDRTITTAFAGAPNNSFSIKGQQVEKNGMTIGMGITLMNKGGLTTSVKYNGELRKGYQAHGIIGEFRFEF